MSEVRTAVETTIVLPEISPELLATYPDLMICVEYLLLRDAGSTMLQVAQHMGRVYPTMPGSRPGLYLRVDRWRRDGTLGQAEAFILHPKIEEMRLAIQYVVTKMPDMLKSMADDVVNQKVKGITKLEYVRFLYEQVALPVLELQEGAGVEERKYVETAKRFNPMIIPEE